MLAKTAPEEEYRTTGTATYPPLMDKAIAGAILDSFINNLAGVEGLFERKLLAVPSVGGADRETATAITTAIPSSSSFSCCTPGSDGTLGRRSAVVLVPAEMSTKVARSWSLASTGEEEETGEGNAEK